MSENTIQEQYEITLREMRKYQCHARALECNLDQLYKITGCYDPAQLIDYCSRAVQDRAVSVAAEKAAVSCGMLERDDVHESGDVIDAILQLATEISCNNDRAREVDGLREALEAVNRERDAIADKLECAPDAISVEVDSLLSCIKEYRQIISTKNAFAEKYRTERDEARLALRTMKGGD